MDDKLIDRFLELDEEKRDLKAATEKNTAERKEVEARLLDEFADSGIDSVKKGGKTIYLHRQLWAKAKDGDRQHAVETLKACGLAEYIKEDFNVQQVSAYAREIDKEGGDYPDGFEDGFDISEVFSVRARRASRN